MHLSTILILPVGIILYAALFAALLLWWVKRARRGRMPMRKDFKLLRSPGEYLQERIAVLDDKLADAFFYGLGIPLVVAWVPLMVLTLAPHWGLPKQATPLILVLILLGFGVSFWVRLRVARGVILERRNYRLGLLGERAVAQALAPIAAEGYHLFHDLPAQDNLKTFNLDHVVIGPAGLFVIETKTRRKPNAAPQDDDHKVRYDGETLYWPQPAAGVYEDRKSVSQAVSEAEWLKKFVHQRLGLTVEVTPLVVIPGYFIDRQGKGTVRVVNEKQLPACIPGRTALDTKTIDQIRRLLDNECRTVAFEG